MRTITMSILAIMIALTTEAQTTINGVTLPATMKAGDATVSLNGGGIRKKLFFKLYVGGLYLSKKSGDANAIINADEAMAVKLQITSSMISSENMSEAITEGFENSTGGNTAPLKSKIDAFVNMFKKSEIVEGNVFDIIYVPGVGVQSYKNGKLEGTIEGMDFKKALFGIWLGNKPADEDLKQAMLSKN
ncbi:MAG: chalcone isomerase [Bacteroidetes bacterium]|nr:MAG: chalcone isomerase [Bacteroidota bacterium]